jgi:RHS repeat-associated protein
MTSAATATQTLTFWYDALGRQLGESGPLGSVRSSYDAAGRRTMLIHPDRSIVTYAYLDTGEMTAIDVSVGLYGTNERLITFGYDGMGRRTSIARANGAGTGYGYDAVGRLASLSHDMAGTARDVTFSYGYNPASQIASRTVSNDVYAAAITNANQSDSHNGLNQISTTAGTPVSHDAKGNMTSDPTVSMTYGYSSENLLTSANGPYGNGTLTYDPIMRLWDSGTGGRTRVLHDGTQRIAEYSQAGGQRNRFVFGPGVDEPLIEYTGAGLAIRQFLHADERGSIIGTSDSSGTSTGVGTFDDYGRYLTFAGFRFGYAGQPYETVSELQYSRARFYNPRIGGRFMQPDPIGYKDGPNLYAAFGGDPINFSDPAGTDAIRTRNGILLAPSRTGIPHVRIPAVREANGFRANRGSGHIYHYHGSSRLRDPATVGDRIASQPTPGPNNSPASAMGTRNNAGSLHWFDNDTNYVMSFRVPSPDPTRFTDITVNYTINSEHALAEGFVMRYGTIGEDGNVSGRVTYGEGSSWLQDPLIEGIWDPISEETWEALDRRLGLK